MNQAIRTSAHVVRLADLDNLYEGLPKPAVGEPKRAHPQPDPEPVFMPPGSSTPGTSDQARRSPHPIGSTLPGALADDVRGVSARPGPKGAQGKARRRRGPTRDVPRLPHGVVHQWPVRFDATGAGYARIWLGNALLLLVTLGLAWPWTHRRALRYFLQHTELAGHRLDFYLPNRLLLPRLGMTAALWLGLVGASVGSFWTGMAALSVGALVWPLLVYLQINHQVGAVTWAGRSLWFDGLWPGIYKVSAVPVALFLGLSWTAALAWQQGGTKGWALVGAVLALAALILPSALWAFYGYRQQHIRLGPLRLHWKALRRDVLRALARTAGWSGLWSLMALGALAVASGAWLALRPGASTGLLWGLAALALGVLVVLWRPALDAALMDVVWNRTGNRHLRFRSRLSTSAYARLYTRNALRLVLTLGAYWPWAVVSVRRMRWQGMAVWSRVDPEVLMQYWVAEPDLASQHTASSTTAPGRGDEAVTTQPSFLSRTGTLD